MKFFIWLKDRFYDDIGMIDFILANCNGIMISSGETNGRLFYQNNKYHLPASLHNIGTGIKDWYELYPELNKYMGEASTVYDSWQWENNKVIKNIWETCNVKTNLERFADKELVDEANPNLLHNYDDYKCKVTYSAYRQFLFAIPLPKFMSSWFGLATQIRIFNPYANQIKTWEKLNKRYGDRFDSCWIHVKSNKNDFKELIDWCKLHNKKIMLYAGDSDITYDELIDGLIKFIKYL